MSFSIHHECYIDPRCKIKTMRCGHLNIRIMHAIARSPQEYAEIKKMKGCTWKGVWTRSFLSCTSFSFLAPCILWGECVIACIWCLDVLMSTTHGFQEVRLLKWSLQMWHPHAQSICVCVCVYSHSGVAGKPVTAELGNMTPYIIVPGNWCVKFLVMFHHAIFESCHAVRDKVNQTFSSPGSFLGLFLAWWWQLGHPVLMDFSSM